MICNEHLLVGRGEMICPRNEQQMCKSESLLLMRGQHDGIHKRETCLFDGPFHLFCQQVVHGWDDLYGHVDEALAEH